MKIDAKIEFNDNVAKEFGYMTTVAIDTDYTESNTESINESVEHELYEKFGVSINPFDYEITNMNELIAELAYEEFLDKTT